MAITKTNKALIPLATQVPAGATTKAAPGVFGAVIDCSTYYGGELNYKITNGASGPSTPMTITFQSSPEGTNWYDYYTVAGDTVGYSQYSGSIQLDRGVMWLRAIGYGNQTNMVTVEAALQAITGV